MFDKLVGPWLTPWGAWVWSDPAAPPAELFGPPPGATRAALLPGSELSYGIDYHSYLRSRAWHEKAQETRRRAGFRCQACRAGGRLEVLHRLYEALGRERPWDLVALCPDCHAEADRKRRAEVAADRHDED